MGEFKKCKYCQTDIPKKAKVCPNCRRTLKSHGCLIALLSFFVFVCIGMAVISGAFGQNKFMQKAISGTSDESEYITMEEYNLIDTGMSYDEVKEIVGSDGEVSSQVESNGIKIVIITWYGNGLAGSNANVTFTNNEVTAKAQVGLQ